MGKRKEIRTLKRVITYYLLTDRGIGNNEISNKGWGKDTDTVETLRFMTPVSLSNLIV